MTVQFDLTVVLDLAGVAPDPVLQRAWRRLRPQVSRIFRAEFNKLRNAARRHAPRRSGKLRRSLRVQFLPAPPLSLRIRVYSPVFYAGLVNRRTGWFDGALADEGFDDENFDATYQEIVLSSGLLDTLSRLLQEAYEKLVAQELGKVFGSRSVRRTAAGIAVKIVTRI